MKPIIQITRTAELITAQGLDRRIPEADADTELLQLIKVINDMLFRLEKNYNQAVRFSGDAAHELQTPLTIIQAMLDDAVQHAENGSSEQQRYNDLLEEVQRLKVIVQKLLILSRADFGQLARHTSPLNFSDLIEMIIEDVTVLAPQLNIEQKIASGIMVQGDRELIRQVVRNLAFNAIKYNIAKGLIRFHLSPTKNHVQLRISNTGHPIASVEREKIFKRFYRIDKSRSNKTTGSSLGLALALEIARAHRGKLFLDTTNNNLITFVLTLPRLH